MNALCPFAPAAVLCAAVAPAANAQQPAAPAKDPQTAPKPAPKPDPKSDPQDPAKYEETVVVSASRTEEKLINAPATMTVIGPGTIESAPTQNFAELLRTVPGVNITQVSARDKIGRASCRERV